MVAITVQFSIDNAAFSNDEAGEDLRNFPEIQRVLQEAGESIEQLLVEGVNTGSVFDINGNRVGRWNLT